MDSETVDTVTGWRSEPYSGGYGGLHELAGREFTGAVTDGTAWLFALNGRVVGVTGGTIESFEDADGTAYVAPDPSLPLLFAMREAGGETRAKYYTNDTPLSEADAKLSAGNFTGYIELSENVLSGDYYVVYHGGNRLACAFVGNSRETLTGEEAFERADDEVGIYEVRTVDIDVVDVPGPEPDAGDPDAGPSSATAADPDADSTEAAGSAGDAASQGASTGTTAGADAADDAAGDDPASGSAPGDDLAAEQSADDPAAEGATANSSAAGSSANSAGSAGSEGPDEPDAGDDGRAASGTSPPVGSTAAEKAEERSRREAAADRPDSDSREESKAAKRRRDGEPTDAVAASESDPFSAEEQWRETRSIPSLDPDQTERGERPEANASRPAAGRDGATAGSDGSRARSRADRPGSSADSDAATSSGSDGATSRSGSGSGSGSSSGPAAGSEEPDERGEAAGDADDGEGDVAAELATARESLTEARSEVERLHEENDRLEGRVETLRADLADARSRLSESGGDAAGHSVSPSRALEGTNLFVRYDSKGAATLEKAHAGRANREDVNGNLRLEVHTEFEDGDAVVGGRPYREWLADTTEYGFVEWVVRDLLYEIQDTGNESAMRDLLDAIPKVDRAELDAAVDLVDEQGKKAEERQFDVVLRDRMGDPLVVANVTDSRDATTEAMLDGLVEGASSVADQYDDLASAFHVTASYFEPGALESVADATGGGLLNRSKQKSFVKLSRKRGFHLCLVESRDGEFHVNVPEL